MCEIIVHVLITVKNIFFKCLYLFLGIEVKIKQTSQHNSEQLPTSLTHRMSSVAVANSKTADTRSDVFLFLGSPHTFPSSAREPLEKFYKESLEFDAISPVHCDIITQHRPTKLISVIFNVNFSQYLLPVHVSDPQGSSSGSQL